MSWSSLPEHLDTPEEWKGTDDWQAKWMRWRLKIKGLFAYSWRSKYWWERWRKIPELLFVHGGEGLWRFEDNDSTSILASSNFELLDKDYYLSRQQKWKRWSIQLQWPLFFAFNFYFKKSDVQSPLKPVDTDGKQFFFYVGAMRDSDQVFWFPSIYAGMNWK